jgi:PAS domain S-box-containing protein
MMTLFDAIIIGTIVVLTPRLKILNPDKQTTIASYLVISGLFLVALFYIADLWLMWIMPTYSSPEASMGAMMDLHLNSRWIVTIISIPLIIFGFLRMKTALNNRYLQAARLSERYQDTIEALPDSLIVVDETDTIREVNGTTLQVLGKTEDQLVGTSVTSLFAEQVDLSSAGPVSSLNAVRASGNQFPASISISRLSDDHRIILLRDATSTVRLQTELQQSQKMESLGRLASGIAHDFNNHLTVILGQAELLGLDGGDPDIRIDRVDRITQAARRSAYLTNQLLSYSRKQFLSPTVINPNRVIDHLDGMMHSIIGEDVRLQINRSSTSGAIRLDVPQLEQALINLLVNARDALPDGGCITIETGDVHLDRSYVSIHPEVTAGRYTMVSVSDNGEGMSTDVTNHAFEPFFTTKPQGKGTGLGLAMIQGFVQQSRGSVTIESQSGVGTSIRMYFPVVDEPEDPTAEAAPNHEQLPGGSETILLAEDDEQVRTFLADVLSRKGYQVLAAGDAAEARTIMCNSVNILLTDLVMPNGNGIELSDAVTDSHPHVKVIFMSGYSETEMRETAMTRDAKLLQKPFPIRELLYTLREVIDR